MIDPIKVDSSIPETIKRAMYVKYQNAGSHYLDHAKLSVTPKGKILHVHPAWRQRVWDACSIILKREKIKLNSLTVSKERE